MLLADNPVLTEGQKAFLSHFGKSPLCKIFYLTGGTALAAFYLQHRFSDDLDFFTEEEVSRAHLACATESRDYSGGLKGRQEASPGLSASETLGYRTSTDMRPEGAQESHESPSFLRPFRPLSFTTSVTQGSAMLHPGLTSVGLSGRRV